MISLVKQQQLISIKLDCDLINTSSSKVFDLHKLKQAIITQIQQVYKTSIGKYQLTVSVDIKILTKENQCSPHKLLFQIVDTIAGNNPAEADFKGLRIKLNKLVISDIINHKNTRTIPHEIGHVFGWDHPHANAAFESVNKTAHILEQQLTEAERQTNLMSQSWYAQRANIPLQKAIIITEKQIDLLLQYYYSSNLNKNRHLKYFFWWRKLL